MSSEIVSLTFLFLMMGLRRLPTHWKTSPNNCFRLNLDLGKASLMKGQKVLLLEPFTGTTDYYAEACPFGRRAKLPLLCVCSQQLLRKYPVGSMGLPAVHFH